MHPWVVPGFCPPKSFLSATVPYTEAKHPLWQECWLSVSKRLGGARCLKGKIGNMPAAGTSLPNLKETRQKSSGGWQPQDRRNIPCRAEKGSSSSSQAGDDNRSPRIPLLLLIGWVPGDVGFSSHYWSASLHSQGSDHVPAHVPAQPLPFSWCEFSTGAALHQPLLYYHLSKARSPRWISQKFWQIHLRYWLLFGLSAAFLKTPLVTKG